MFPWLIAKGKKEFLKYSVLREKELYVLRCLWDCLIEVITNRKQRTRIGNNYSSWRDILSGVPQGSILGPILFNIYVCDVFFLLKRYACNVVNYADDTTPYIYSENIESVIKSWEQSANLLFNWFKSNQMKDNKDKRHVLLSTDEMVQVNIGNACINNSKCEKLLGIIWIKITFFKRHVSIKLGSL